MKHPVFGDIVLASEYPWWEGEVRLPFFANFDTLGNDIAAERFCKKIGNVYKGPDPKATPEYRRRREGYFRSRIHNEDGKGPSPAQEQALRHLLDSDRAVCQAVIDGIFKSYLEQYDAYREGLGQGWADPQELEDILPRLVSPVGLVTLICLSSLDFHEAHKEGASYVGFSFHATWEEEHGIGVLTHGGKIVEVGIMDTAFTEHCVE